MSISNFDEVRKDLISYLTQQLIYDVILDSFDTLKADRDKVELCWFLLSDSKLFPDFKLSNVKSKELSEKFRLEGNRAFAKRKDFQAIRSYTLAAGHAPQGSKELVLAVANRSAVSSCLNDHINCLRDIDFSIEKNYPNNLKYKLIERKGKALLCLGRYQAALSTLQEALASLSFCDLAGSKLEKVRDDITDLMNECCKQLNETDITIDNLRSTVPEIPALSHGRHEFINSASQCIDIAFSQEMGRHLIATRDILPGEVLAVEKPYVSILLPESAGLYCSHCLKRCHSLLPCPHCTEVYFCSSECESLAAGRYHKVECGLLRSLLGLGCGKLELLAVRTVVEAAEQGLNLTTLTSSIPQLEQPVDPPTRRGFTNGQYDSGSYAAVHCLEGNSHHRSSMDLFRRAIAAACIVEAMDKASNFFLKVKKCDNIESSKNGEGTGKNICKSFKLLEPYFRHSKVKNIGNYKAVVGGLLLKYLQVVPSNAHEVSEMLIDRSNHTTESTEIGGALYPLLSLTNHSCDPNVVRHSHNGDTVVLTAIQCIAKGQQIFDNYGYHHAVHDRTYRQTSLLSQYHFYCQCQACINDWPLYQDMPDSQPTYYHGVDEKYVKESSKKFTNVLTDILNSNSNDLDFLTYHLQLLHMSIERPHREYSGCQEAIKQCLSQLANHYVT